MESVVAVFARAGVAFVGLAPTRVTPLLSLTVMLRPRAVLLYVAALFLFSMLAGLLYG